MLYCQTLYSWLFFWSWSFILVWSVLFALSSAITTHAYGDLRESVGGDGETNCTLQLVWNLSVYYSVGECLPMEIEKKLGQTKMPLVVIGLQAYNQSQQWNGWPSTEQWKCFSSLQKLVQYCLDCVINRAFYQQQTFLLLLRKPLQRSSAPSLYLSRLRLDQRLWSVGLSPSGQNYICMGAETVPQTQTNWTWACEIRLVPRLTLQCFKTKYNLVDMYVCRYQFWQSACKIVKPTSTSGEAYCTSTHRVGTYKAEYTLNAANV